MKKVKFAIPAGSLSRATFNILRRAGYNVSSQERTYRPTINDPKIELKILRPQEIPVFVSEGLQDVGITGQDWIKETGANVEILQNLEYGKIKLIVAIPKNSNATSISDLMEDLWSKGKNFRVSTEYLNIAAEYIQNTLAYKKRFGKVAPLMVTPWWKRGENPRVKIFLSFGATEAKPPENSDCIIDVTETGSTIDANNLKIIETVLESSAVLIANKLALQDEGIKEKIYDILTLLKGVVDGSKRIHIFVNVKKTNLQKLLKGIPALKNPTVAPLADKSWVSVNTILEKDCFIRLLPTIRKLAQGIVVYEPRQVLALDEVTRREGKVCPAKS
ncbi:MAG: ATP phosphoribosyltransferase [Candidatus Bathyarchaeota archaeon]|jgi:ATP phosphoribosyltransferase|nr:ATP phosphoribosyltransferase [Candidatus Bathyarchaeota archaeon]